MSRPYTEENPGRRDPNREYAYDGFTPQQYAYCDARIAGLTPMYAFRQAYNNDHTPADQVTIRANMLERDARIVARINAGLAKKAAQSNLVPVVERIEVSKDWVVQGIARLAADTAIKANTRLAAYIAVGKSAGVDAFRDIVVHEKRTRTIDEIDAEIARHLANMIDVTPNAQPQSGSPLPLAPISREQVNERGVNKNTVKDRRRKPTPG